MVLPPAKENAIFAINFVVISKFGTQKDLMALDIFKTLCL